MTDTTATPKPASRPMFKAMLAPHGVQLEFKVAQGADDDGPATYVEMLEMDIPVVVRPKERMVIEIIGGEVAQVTVTLLPPEGA